LSFEESISTKFFYLFSIVGLNFFFQGSIKILNEIL